MALTESYSLWLMPGEALADRLQREIDELTVRFDDAPRFQPHVTLLGGIDRPAAEVLPAAQALAKQLKPYPIKFDHVAHGSAFHQCVYLLCKKTEAAMAAAAAARQAFGQDPGSTYMPHLSLLYSNIDQATRAGVAVEEQGKLLGSAGNGGGAGSAVLQNDGFLVDSLAVWYTPLADKSLGSWHQVAEYPLDA